jgi:hypothetical protein
VLCKLFVEEFSQQEYTEDGFPDFKVDIEDILSVFSTWKAHNLPSERALSENSRK